MTPRAQVPASRRHRSRVVAASLTALMAANLMAGCSSDDGTDDGTDDAAQICIDQQTQQRLPDEDCQPSYHHEVGISPVWFWVMLNSNGHRGVDTIPGVGSRVNVGNYGSYQAPGGSSRVSTGVGEHGESVSHGGFGNSSHGGSGE